MAADDNYDGYLDKLADTHSKRLSDALEELEDRIAAALDDAPVKAGALFDLEWAVKARPELAKIMSETYLREATSMLNDYSKVSVKALDMLNEYGDFTKTSPEIIKQLQSLTFKGFEDIATSQLDTIASEVYQNTLTGRTKTEMVKSVRQSVNGVYISSNDDDIERLVNIAKNGSASASAAAVKELHSVYASDRVGGNMRRYATQMAQDSLMQFDASINTQMGKDAGIDTWKYYGDLIKDSRQFCRDHVGNVYTTAEIEEIWQGSWAGKSSSDGLIARGGYNCRHHFRPYIPDGEGEVENKVNNTRKKDNPEKVDVFETADNGLSTEFITGASNITKKEINTAMNAITDKQLALVNRLPKPSRIVAKQKGGLYSYGVKTITTGLQRSGSVVRHEYGHHIDYMLGEKLGRKGLAFSTVDEGFGKAFLADRKKLNLHSSKLKEDSMDNLRDQLYDKEVRSFELGGKTRFADVNVIKTDEMTAVSDIVDAMTGGLFSKRYSGWGHGTSYYSRKGSKQKETFANLFALRSKPEWEVIEKNFPLLAKRFDEITDVRRLGDG